MTSLLAVIELDAVKYVVALREMEEKLCKSGDLETEKTHQTHELWM